VIGMSVQKVYQYCSVLKTLVKDQSGAVMVEWTLIFVLVSIPAYIGCVVSFNRMIAIYNAQVAGMQYVTLSTYFPLQSQRCCC